MTGIILQLVTQIVGASAIYIISRKAPYYRYGYAVGLCSQALWLSLFLYFKQYFMLPSVLLYGYVWYSGLRNHFCKRKNRCIDCKYWKFHIYAPYYVNKPKWFFRECALWLHQRKPACLSDEKELYKRKLWKFWR